MLSKRVVLIADRIKDHNNATLQSNDLEVVADNYFIPLLHALKNISPQVIHYSSLTAFTRNIESHKNDVILSIWSGTGSRNRRILVPAICEANNIIYVGADAYLQGLAQDKDLSKLFLSKYGIKSPKSVLIYSYNDYNALERLKYPIIIKPNFEGGSIGIFNNNVVYSASDAALLSNELLQTYCPLLAEEYISGEEISFCISGTEQEIIVFEIIRQYINGNTYFNKEIMGAEYKKIFSEQQLWDNVTNQIPDKEKKQIIDLYFHLGKAELIRIDGRLNASGFYAIELSTDVGISVMSTMTQAFESAGYTYEEMLETIINNAIRSWEYQNANRL